MVLGHELGHYNYVKNGYHKALGIVFVLRFDQFFPYFLFTIRKCFGFAFLSTLGFILLFLSCYFVSSNIFVRLGFLLLRLEVSSNVKFLFFISKIGESKMAFVRVFLLLKCGVLKHTFSYYSKLTNILYDGGCSVAGTVSR